MISATLLLLLAFPAQDERVDAVLAKQVGEGEPGAAVLVLRKGKVLHRKGYGLANVEHGVAVDSRTQFRLASVSKQFTAMAVMILAEKGKLAYKDDIRKTVPELPEWGVTIEHLLRHTSGIPDYLNFLGKAGKPERRIRNRDVPALLAEAKTAFPPGSKFEYSNSNYCLLALIIERVTEKSFGAFLKEAVFGPLKMDGATVCERSTQLIPKRAYGYRKVRGNFRTSHSDLSTTGDGAVFCSLENFEKWDRGLATLVKKETLARAFDGGKFGYGYGWVVGKDHVQHSGGWLGASTTIVRYKDGLTIVVLSNRDGFPVGKVAGAIAKIFRKEY